MDIGTVASAWQSDNELMTKMLVAQLQNQNPMDPMSNAELVSQMSQLATLDSMNHLRQDFGEILQLYKLIGGAQVVGRQVEYMEGDELAYGEVGAVSTTDGSVRLAVNGTEVELDSVRRIL
jgi:flagellar basal-body rod modification protein FlgD